MGTKHYYKKKLVDQNLEVEYSSEEDMVTIRVENKLKMGASIGSEWMRIHPSYIEPLYKLLTEVTAQPEINSLQGDDSVENGPPLVHLRNGTE